MDEGGIKAPKIAVGHHHGLGGVDRPVRRALPDHAVEADHVVRSRSDAHLDAVLEDVRRERMPFEVRDAARAPGAQVGRPRKRTGVLDDRPERGRVKVVLRGGDAGNKSV